MPQALIHWLACAFTDFMWTGACVSVKTLGKEIAIYDVNSYTGKTASSYWEGTERPLVPEGFTIN